MDHAAGRERLPGTLLLDGGWDGGCQGPAWGYSQFWEKFCFINTAKGEGLRVGEELTVGEGLSLTAPLLSPWCFKCHPQDPRAAIGTAAQCLETLFPDVLKLYGVPGGADFVISTLSSSGFIYLYITYVNYM